MMLLLEGAEPVVYVLFLLLVSSLLLPLPHLSVADAKGENAVAFVLSLIDPQVTLHPLSFIFLSPSSASLFISHLLLRSPPWLHWQRASSKEKRPSVTRR